MATYDKDSVHIKGWVEDLPPIERDGGRKSKWDSVITELKTERGRWALVLEGTPGQATAAAQTLRARSKGAVEARTRKGNLYARWVGEKE